MNRVEGLQILHLFSLDPVIAVRLRLRLHVQPR